MSMKKATVPQDKAARTWEMLKEHGITTLEELNDRYKNGPDINMAIFRQKA